MVTGCYAGIGIETVRALSSAGAQVTMACRDLNKAKTVATEINESLGSSNVDASELDLGKVSSVREFVAAYSGGHEKLDILYQQWCSDGLPKRCHQRWLLRCSSVVNHIGHFVLTTGLIPLLKNAGSAASGLFVLNRTFHQSCGV